MWKIGAIISIAALLCACTNEMVPINNPPDYQNRLVQGKSGRWYVDPIQCPIVYDPAGHIKPSLNLNCATVRNLGLMLAEPEDILYSTRSGNIKLYERNKPIVYRSQPVARAAQKYYNDKLPKVQDTNIMNGGFYTPGQGIP